MGEGPVRYRDRELSFAPPFRRVTMKHAILEAAGREGLALSAADLEEAAALEAEHRARYGAAGRVAPANGEVRT